MSAVRLILASASPRRRELLREAGLDFLVHPSNVDESALGLRGGVSPEEFAGIVARAKAESVVGVFPDDIVLAADTVVALGGQILGKPVDADDARRILSLLGGSTHRVVTAVVVIYRGQIASQVVSSTVEMRPLSAGELDAYIASNQWEGKAGAYGIQDRDPFVTRISGCLTNIVGLPMTTTARMLRDMGYEPSVK